MPNKKITLVFVHGWSVTSTNTYGGLPERLLTEAAAHGLNIQIKQIFLGRYISFHDEVRVSDISCAFEAAVKDQLANLLKNNLRFVCITHSTGGPIIRDWWFRYYMQQSQSKNVICPMSHLIMLAPANYGSALAQLGKSRLSRMKFWLGGVEPGQGVLDWLELGSEQSWQLNKQWITSSGNQIGVKGVFPFVLTGQSIDHAVYDHLNTYTGEMGSDGVVRVAAANLQGLYVRLVQQKPQQDKNNHQWAAPKLILKSSIEAPPSVLCVIKGKSHSGSKMGIMRSIKKGSKDQKSQAVVKAIFDCIKITNKLQYQQLADQFGQQNETVQAQEQLEVVQHLLHKNSYFYHDRYSMLIFRVVDHQGRPVKDFDLILTAGKDSNPDHLPRGFFVDRQRNQNNPETITYYFNHDVMKGSKAVYNAENKVIRDAYIGTQSFGLKVIPRPDHGFVYYLPCEITASKELLEKIIKPNTTSLIEICLQRVVNKQVMRLDKGVKQASFKNIKPGENLIP